MSKTDKEMQGPTCLRCETVFFGNPVSQHAETAVLIDGKLGWYCQACQRIRNRAEAALQRAAWQWHPSQDGKKCERCRLLVDRKSVLGHKYAWYVVDNDWSFHCQHCKRTYETQRFAYPCDTHITACDGCQFVIATSLAEEAGWDLVPETGEANCPFCKLEPGQPIPWLPPLSCTSKPQESSRVENKGRNAYRWVQILTLALTLVAIGGNWRCNTLLLASASLAMAIAKQFVRAEKLRELLARKKVQM